MVAEKPPRAVGSGTFEAWINAMPRLLSTGSVVDVPVNDSVVNCPGEIVNLGYGSPRMTTQFEGCAKSPIAPRNKTKRDFIEYLSE